MPNSQNHAKDTAQEKPQIPKTGADGDTIPGALCDAFNNAKPIRKATVRRKKQEETPPPIPSEKPRKKTAAKKGKEAKDVRVDGGDIDIFREVIEARKASEARLKQQEEKYASLLAIAEMSGTADEIAGQIAYRRLVADGTRDKLQAALKLLDEQEALLKKRLGLPPKEEKAPAQTAAHPGWRGETAPKMPIPPVPRIQEGFAAEKNHAVPARLHDLIQSAESYFRLYQDEPGHDIRMQHIRQYFRNPAQINEFLAIHDPGSWAAQFKYMYDNIIIPPSADAGEQRHTWQEAYGGEEEAPPSSTEELIWRNMERMGL